MPFCPDCRYEFRKEIETCPDCGVKLVDQLKINNTHEEIRWVPLHELPGTTYAEMVKEVLERENIPCYIRSDFLSVVYNIKSVSTTGSKAIIYVPEKYKERAEEILTGMFNHI